MNALKPFDWGEYYRNPPETLEDAFFQLFLMSPKAVARHFARQD